MQAAVGYTDSRSGVYLTRLFVVDRGAAVSGRVCPASILANSREMQFYRFVGFSVVRFVFVDGARLSPCVELLLLWGPVTNAASLGSIKGDVYVVTCAQVPA